MSGWPHIEEKQTAMTTLRNTTKDVFGHAFWTASVVSVFTATQCTLESVREHDRWNNIIAGCVAGGLAGMKNGSIPTTLGGCVGLGTIMALAELREGSTSVLAEKDIKSSHH